MILRVGRNMAAIDGCKGGHKMTDACRYPEGEFRLERLSNDWQVGRFAALETVGVAHFVTARQGSNAPQVRHSPILPWRKVTQVLGLKDAAFLKPARGGSVLLCAKGGCAGSADGLVTTAEGLALVGQSDGYPIVLIADSHRRAAGLAHASWRATVAGITPALVRRMVDLGCSLRHLVACICPSVGPCCYEVGEADRTLALQQIGPHALPFFRCAGRDRPARAVSDAVRHESPLHLDLWRANACALARAGLPARSIHAAGLCTACREDLFPHHGREGHATGRFAAAIGWAAPAPAGLTKARADRRCRPENGVALQDY
jgi:copper oxidase (laccase) domain-containing protein